VRKGWKYVGGGPTPHWAGDWIIGDGGNICAPGPCSRDHPAGVEGAGERWIFIGWLRQSLTEKCGGGAAESATIHIGDFRDHCQPMDKAIPNNRAPTR